MVIGPRIPRRIYIEMQEPLPPTLTPTAPTPPAPARPVQPLLITNLPLEILDMILSHLSSPTDLVSLGLTSKSLCLLAIPRHSAYRIIRVRHRFPDLWMFLATRVDLVSGLREVRVGRKGEVGVVERVPRVPTRRVTGVMKPVQNQPARPSQTQSQLPYESHHFQLPSQSRLLLLEEEQTRTENIITVLSHARSLESFHWDFRYGDGCLSITREEDEVELIRALSGRGLSRLGRWGSRTDPGGDSGLKRLALMGNFSFLRPRPKVSVGGVGDARIVDVDGKEEKEEQGTLFQQAWNMPNLEALTLMGEAWTWTTAAGTLNHVLKNCSGLTTLQLPIECTSIISSPTSNIAITLPNLRRLSLFLQTGTTPSSIQQWNVFLERHPDLEDLWCFPSHGMIVLPKHGMRELRRVSVEGGWVESFFNEEGEEEEDVEGEEAGEEDVDADAEDAGGQEGREGAENTSTCLPLPQPHHRLLTRPIPTNLQCLHLPSFQFSSPSILQTLASRTGFFRNLKRLRLGRLGSVQEMEDLVGCCGGGAYGGEAGGEGGGEGGLEWLGIDGGGTMFGLETWLSFLSSFPNLHTFRGQGIWTSPDVNGDNDRMHDAILQLVMRCPRLVELDHKSVHAKRGRRMRIVIVRERKRKRIEDGDEEDGVRGGDGDGEEGEEGEVTSVRYEIRKPRERDKVFLMDDVFDELGYPVCNV